MVSSLKSKKGRSILKSLASNLSQGEGLSPEAGRNLVGALGFRLVGFVRQFFQAPGAYQEWLHQQHNVVANEFIIICQKESSEDSSGHIRQQVEGFSLQKNSELSSANLAKLKEQTSKLARPRVLTPIQLEKMLMPTVATSKDANYSGLKRLLSLFNPFDQAGELEGDWLSRFRSSGRALKIEMTKSLSLYHQLLQSEWHPEDQNSWITVGARLLQMNDEIVKLCQSAEELVLTNLAKEAGFNLSLIFTLLKGLSSERTILTSLVASPSRAQNAKTWEQAMTMASAI
jgi:hypothetical protein